jgi:hypothetical protein
MSYTIALPTTGGAACQVGPSSCTSGGTAQNLPYAMAASASVTCQMVTNNCSPNSGNGNAGNCGAACCFGVGGELPGAGPVTGDCGPAGYLGGAVIPGGPFIACIRTA